VKVGGCPDAWQRWPRDVASSALFLKEFATALASAVAVVTFPSSIEFACRLSFEKWLLNLIGTVGALDLYEAPRVEPRQVHIVLKFCIRLFCHE
jgi:hypothetical protein